MNFLNGLKETQDTKQIYSITENGAIGYQTTKTYLLDLHFRVSSFRKASDSEIIAFFLKAYYEDKLLAMKWLFYARDVRNGLGERRLFKTIFLYLVEHDLELPIKELINLIPTYGRYDDLFDLLETPYQYNIIALIANQLKKDWDAYTQNSPISLLAKWLPSINASSERTKARGRLIASKLGMKESEYRKMLSSLRKHLNIVECHMSANAFDKINYEAVPSRANLIYKDAFLRQDEHRRKAFLLSLQKGEAKIHSSVLYPHDIVHAYMSGYHLGSYDETLEQLWNALDNTTGGLENTIVVADGSGSMLVPVGNGTCTALSVANALAIYFAQRSEGQLKDHYITFSEHPKLVDLRKGKNLKEKIQIALSYNEVANTDIYKVFQLILQTALNQRMEQSELPKNIVIISDMEFDSCAKNANANLFMTIKEEYLSHGYELPRLVFWNVNSRTNTIPVKENKLGVALVSGFSINIFEMLLSNELDAYQCLVKTLCHERYDAIDACFH